MNSAASDVRTVEIRIRRLTINGGAAERSMLADFPNALRDAVANGLCAQSSGNPAENALAEQVARAIIARADIAAPEVRHG